VGGAFQRPLTKELPLSLTSFAPGCTARSAAPATPERYGEAADWIR
jgi:hypothetical protein